MTVMSLDGLLPIKREGQKDCLDSCKVSAERYRIQLPRYVSFFSLWCPNRTLEPGVAVQASEDYDLESK